MKLRSWIMYLIYRKRHTTALDELPKLTEVVMSCDSPAHCDVALRYLRLYTLRHLSAKEDGYTLTAKAVIKQFAMFLEDTRHHCEHGWHKPEHNGHEPIHKYPNMNDYAGKVLSVRFKPFWERGVTSVAGPK